MASLGKQTLRAGGHLQAHLRNLQLWGGHLQLWGGPGGPGAGMGRADPWVSLRPAHLSVSSVVWGRGGDHCRAQVNLQILVDRASRRTARQLELPPGGLSAQLLLSRPLPSTGGQEETGSQEQRKGRTPWWRS